MKLLAFLFSLVLLSSCSNVGVGGTVSGGSGGHIHGGVGVGIHLLTEPDNRLP